MSIRCRISDAARSISVAPRQRRLGLDCQNGFTSSSTRSTSLPQKVLRNSKCPVTAMVLSFPGPWLLATGSGRADLTNVAYSQAVPVGRGQRRSRVKTARKTEFSSFVLSLFAILLSQDHRARVRSLRARCLDRGAPIHLVQQTLGHASVATTGRYLHARPRGQLGPLSRGVAGHARRHTSQLRAPGQRGTQGRCPCKWSAMACALYQRRMFPAAANWTPEPTYSGRPRRAGRFHVMAELGHSALPTSASICEADQLFLANVESINVALAAAVKGRRHGNRAALRLWQLDGRPPLRG